MQRMPPITLPCYPLSTAVTLAVYLTICGAWPISSSYHYFLLALLRGMKASREGSVTQDTIGRKCRHARQPDCWPWFAVRQGLGVTRTVLVLHDFMFLAYLTPVDTPEESRHT